MVKSLFTFTFENHKKIYCRKYSFEMNFLNTISYEKALDWAETSGDVLDFIDKMNDYGVHEVSFNPASDFYGFISYDVEPRHYIKVMESWKSFFVNHNINCDDIIEVIEDKVIA